MPVEVVTKRVATGRGSALSERAAQIDGHLERAHGWRGGRRRGAEAASHASHIRSTTTALTAATPLALAAATATGSSAAAATSILIAMSGGAVLDASRRYRELKNEDVDAAMYVLSRDQNLSEAMRRELVNVGDVAPTGAAAVRKIVGKKKKIHGDI